MTWTELPIAPIKTFNDFPLKSNVRDNDGELVLKRFKCHGCAEIFTCLSNYRDHLRDEHIEEEDNYPMPPIEAETVDATTTELLIDILLSFQGSVRQKEHEFYYIQKTNDGHHAQETHRRIKIAIDRGDSVVKLKKEQYDWLHGLLSRKLPILRKKDETVDTSDSEKPISKTVAMFFWGLSEDTVLQQLKPLGERRIQEKDEE